MSTPVVERIREGIQEKRSHRLFRHNFRFTTFVSIFLLAVDPNWRELTYVNAGHNPPSDDITLIVLRGTARP
jgi:hypothetical protein